MKDGEMVNRIFSLLDADGDLDDRLSGYFEKVSGKRHRAEAGWSHLLLTSLLAIQIRSYLSS